MTPCAIFTFSRVRTRLCCQGVNIAERIQELVTKGLAKSSDNPVKAFIWNDKNPNKVRDHE